MPPPPGATAVPTLSPFRDPSVDLRTATPSSSSSRDALPTDTDVSSRPEAGNPEPTTGSPTQPPSEGAAAASFDPADPDTLLAAARRGGDYLTRATGPEGRYTYRYRAATNESVGGYNILRHAGTTFSLLQLFRETRDPLHLAAGERAIEALLAATGPCPGPTGFIAPAEAAAAAAGIAPPRLLCVAEDGEVKLGGNALAVVALVEHAEATGSRRFVAEAQALARWIVAVQSAEGEFVVHKITEPDGNPTDFVSGYYPGEALLALLRLYELDGDRAWLDAAERGGRWLIDVRDGTVADDDLAHDHWLLYALARLHRHAPDPVWVAHASRLSRAILDAQLRPNQLFPGEELWAGGWYRPPRSTPAATRSEGLASAWAMIRESGDDALADAVLNGLLRAAAYQLRTQVDIATATGWPAPAAAVGGFRRDLDSDEIRIDYVQHNISALLLLREVLLVSGRG